MELIHLVVILLVFIVLYLLYKTRNLEKLSIEKFETDITTLVNNKYKADIDAIRNLAGIAATINNSSNNTLRLPANTTIIARDLIINGGIKVTNKDTVMLEIFPKFMVIAWAHSTIPLGWAVCDGKRYSLDNTNRAIIDVGGQLTPDLRGRFILGSGFGAKDMNDKFLSERALYETGGEENHSLNKDEIPGHTHSISYPLVGCSGGDCRGGSRWVMDNVEFKTGDSMTYGTYSDPGGLPRSTGNTGGVLRANTGNKSDGALLDYDIPPIWDALGHNNMPPFYVLTYIMKL